jgi:hypothetical protein
VNKRTHSFSVFCDLCSRMHSSCKSQSPAALALLVLELVHSAHLLVLSVPLTLVPCLPAAAAVAASAGWQHDFAKSFTKMVGLGVRWSSNAFYPTWRECKAYTLAPGAAPGINCTSCSRLGAFRVDEPAVVGPPAGYRCPAACVCNGEYSRTAVSAWQQQRQQQWL